MDPLYPLDLNLNTGYLSNEMVYPSPLSGGNTVSVTPNARMKTYGVSSVPQQTRHARRIYVGGIPPNYIDEDGIRIFMNNVIAQGLGEENDHSYVLSIYINQKKCFAFIELRSIELATACLDLDGIIMKNVVLRVLRANEYKPELIPQSLNKVIKFDLSQFQFGPTANVATQGNEQDEPFVERTLDSLIQFTGLQGLENGSVTIVGFPFDDNNANANNPNNNNKKAMTPSIASRSSAAANISSSSSANTPKLFRNLLRKAKYGQIENPEFDIDISRLKVVDVGDVLTGKSSEETKLNLATTTAELVSRGSVPFVLGGAKDLSYFSGSGLLSLFGPKLAVISVCSRGDIKILEDARFYGAKTFPLNCHGRFVLFAAQGSEISKDEANYLGEHGGKIVWLTKHLRGATASLSAPDMFREILRDFSKRDDGNPVPVMVTLDAGVLNAASNPHIASTNSPHGLTLEEITEIARIAGADPNVVLVNATDFIIEAEEHSRENFIALDIFYHFLLGYGLRKEIVSPKNQQQQQHLLQQQQRKQSESPHYRAMNMPQQSSVSSQMDDLSLSELKMRATANNREGGERERGGSRDFRQLSDLSNNNNNNNSNNNVSNIWNNNNASTHSLRSSETMAVSSISSLSSYNNNNNAPLTGKSPSSSANDLQQRHLAKTMSSMSSLSTNPPGDRYNRSTSSYTMRNSSSFTNYPLNVNPPRVVGSSPSRHNSGVFHQLSVPDMLNDFHQFDESIDLGGGMEGERGGDKYNTKPPLANSNLNNNNSINNSNNNNPLDTNNNSKFVSHHQLKLLPLNSQSNETSQTAPYSTVASMMADSLISPSSQVTSHNNHAGFTFDEKLLNMNNLNINNPHSSSER